ncbi:MAG TPA: hypothetical protein VNC40_16170 [Gaiellaceae bacterium]|nr:hypothetical protein [Gaiellaceae bacterium]
MLVAPEIVGGVVSATVTGNCVVAVMLCASVAVHVTVVVPSGNVAPLVWSQPTVTASPGTSVAVGVLKLTAAPDALVASAVIGAGTFWNVGTGAVTVTVNETGVDRLPAGSRAWQVATPDPPEARIVPEGMLHEVVIWSGVLSGSVTVRE